MLGNYRVASRVVLSSIELVSLVATELKYIIKAWKQEDFSQYSV
jgi:hypothetical protein